MKVRLGRRNKYEKYRDSDPRVPKQLLNRTLSSRQIESMRHTFLRMAEHAFDRDERAGVPVHQVGPSNHFRGISRLTTVDTEK